MNKAWGLLFGMLSFCIFSCSENKPTETVSEIETSEKLVSSKPVIVLHGGAGSVTRDHISDSLAQAYESSLNEALQIGWRILEQGGSSLEAVEQTIRFLENDPLYNAGKGSVLNAQGIVENDASIMDGASLQAGAIAGVYGLKNPISAARLVKDSTSHVLLAGTGAYKFAKESGLELVDQDYFLTPIRLKDKIEILKENKHGTVGVAAIDKNGNLAAGTSTGGMHKKKFGRVGDSPIIGAGTYANNNTCAVSCTGHGEFFIKNAVAYDMHALMEYKGYTVQQAAQEIIQDKLVKQKALGGLIAVDKNGNVAMEFNTPGMFRAYKNENEQHVAMFAN
ncbi:MAG: isoaspartyl peptidase/L-asparaginase [Bacteroidetes bacterium]|nr:isoaspartyl peptidase/L-asparaginase [Bacteroidota bacterium]